MRISTGARVPEGTGAVVPVDAARRRPAGEGARARRGREHPPRAARTCARATVLARGHASSGPRSWACWPAGPRECECARAPAGGAAGDRRRAGRAAAARWAREICELERARARRRWPTRRRRRVVLARRVRATTPRPPAALAGADAAADVVCVSGGVSVGPHDHVKGALADAGRRGALLARGAAARASRRGSARPPATTLWPSGCPGNPVSAGHLPAVRPARAAGAPGRRPRPPRGSSARLDAARRSPARAASRRCACALRDGADGLHGASRRGPRARTC